MKTLRLENSKIDYTTIEITSDTLYTPILPTHSCYFTTSIAHHILKCCFQDNNTTFLLSSITPFLSVSIKLPFPGIFIRSLTSFTGISIHT